MSTKRAVVTLVKEIAAALVRALAGFQLPSLQMSISMSGLVSCLLFA